MSKNSDSIPSENSDSMSAKKFQTLYLKFFLQYITHNSRCNNKIKNFFKRKRRKEREICCN